MSSQASQPFLDCFAPTLGHTALRCAMLSDSQQRWLMLPATLYFLASLVTALNWIRLILAQRDIRSQHFFYLFVHGALAFSLAASNYTHRVDEQPYGSSRAIGGVSVLSVVTLIAAIATFLPPRDALKASLDRMLTATGFGSALLVLLSSISRYSPDGVNKETRNIFLAAAACMLTFLVASLLSSQQSRFFALAIGSKGTLHAFVSLESKSNILFIASVTFLMAQTPFAFVEQPQFSQLMAASMLGVLGYVLLVVTSIVSHYQGSLRSNLQEMPDLRGREIEKRENESFHIVGDLEHKLNVVNDSNVPKHSGRPHRRQPSQSLGVARTAHSTVNEGLSNRESVVWKGDAAMAPRLPLHSGVSAASWDRLERLMQDRRRAQSGLTYYGSELSYAQHEGAPTRPTSMLTASGLTSFLGIGGKGRAHDVAAPPVPPIDPKYIDSHERLDSVIIAKPLTEGDEPIVLSPVPLSDSARAKSPIQRGLSHIPGLLWSGASGTRQKQARARKTPSHAPSAVVTDVLGHKQRAFTLDCSEATTVGPHHPSVEAESVRSLAIRYSSSKLFPSPMTADTLDVATDTPQPTPRRNAETTTQYASRHAGDPHTSSDRTKIDELVNGKIVRQRSTGASVDVMLSAQVEDVEQSPTMPDAISPSSATAVSPSRKVNRGKVIRKADGAEDHNARVAGAILFPLR